MGVFHVVGVVFIAQHGCGHLADVVIFEVAVNQRFRRTGLMLGKTDGAQHLFGLLDVGTADAVMGLNGIEHYAPDRPLIDL
jgi:hypothetical protein